MRNTTADAMTIATRGGADAARLARRCVFHDRVILVRLVVEAPAFAYSIERIRSRTSAGESGRSSRAFSRRSSTSWFAPDETARLRSDGGRGRSIAWRTIIVAA